MLGKPKTQKSEDKSYAHETWKLLEDFSCTKIFDRFHEEAKNGSIIGIAGDNFAIIAADARDAEETNQTMHKITKKLILAATGDQCCTASLASQLRARMFMNEYMRKREIPSLCVAKLLSCILTNQHCHKKHVATMLAGLDHEGKGAIYAYNPLGYHDKVRYRAMGAAFAVLQPILNERLTPQLAAGESLSRCSETKQQPSEQRAIEELSLRTATKTPLRRPPKISFNEAFDLIVCAFKAAAARADVYTGSVLVLNAVTKEGCFTHEIILNHPRKSLECWV